MPPNKALRRRDDAFAVRGLSELQRALRRAEGDAQKHLRAELKTAASVAREKARGFITHTTGRRGNAGPPLADTLRVSVTQAGASVWSDAPHAVVQDVGGRVGRGQLTVLRRGEVSRYMTRGVQSAQPEIEARVNAALDRVERDFER